MLGAGCVHRRANLASAQSQETGRHHQRAGAHARHHVYLLFPQSNLAWVPGPRVAREQLAHKARAELTCYVCTMFQGVYFGICIKECESEGVGLRE